MLPTCVRIFVDNSNYTQNTCKSPYNWTGGRDASPALSGVSKLMCKSGLKAVGMFPEDTLCSFLFANFFNNDLNIIMMLPVTLVHPAVGGKEAKVILSFERG